MPELFRRFAPAKINLALHVLGRRPDGFHELDTLAVFADIGDWVGVDVADDLTLSLSGPFATHAPAGSENLALRAAALLKETTGYVGGAALALEKNLPAGAGLGGGSADAAAVLQALNYFWCLGLEPHDLFALGSKLGADVPMCLHRFALRARGSGMQECIVNAGTSCHSIAMLSGSTLRRKHFACYLNNSFSCINMMRRNNAEAEP